MNNDASAGCINGLAAAMLALAAATLPACRQAAPPPAATAAPARSVAEAPRTAPLPSASDLGGAGVGVTGGDQLSHEVMPGVSIGDVRKATDELAAKRRAEGQRPGPSLEACQALAAMSIVTRCISIGAGGGGEPQDRASFELPNPIDGRGIIHHYGTTQAFDRVQFAFAVFEKEHGSFVVTNRRALLVWLGAEQLTAAQKERVRAFITSR